MKAPIIFIFVVFIAVCSHSQKQLGDPTLTEIWSPVPKVITPGRPAFTGAPSDAIVLFGNAADSMNWIGKDGKPFSWKTKDSVLTIAPFAGDLQTKKVFGDCQLHIEWRTPTEISGEGQGRGNSGIFLMSRYELQVLDSYNNSTYSNGQAGSIYKQHIH